MLLVSPGEQMKRSQLASALFVATVAAGLTAATTGSADAGTTSPNAVSPAALTSNWYASAPYLMPQSNNPPDPTVVMAATGQKAFQLAFILAPNGGGCSPT